jgi:hypothetical protein
MPSSQSTSRMTKMVHSIPASQSVDAVRAARAREPSDSMQDDENAGDRPALT